MYPSKARHVRVNVKDLVINTILLLLSVFCLFFEGGIHNVIASYVILLINICSVIKVRKNWYLFIIAGLIAYSNYSIVYANHLVGLKTYYTTFAHEEVANVGINILLFFSLTFHFVLPRVKEKNVRLKAMTLNNRYNPAIVIALIFVLALILVFGFTRPEVDGVRGTPSSFYEYSIIVFIIAVYYSGKNRLLHFILTALMVAFALQNFVFGGRVTGLQLIVCWILCFMIDRISVKKMLPFAIVGFVILSIIGEMRASVKINTDSIAASVKRSFENGITLDTAYSSYFTSLTFLKYRETIGLGERVELAFRYLLSVFLGGSVSRSNLANITRSMILHYYGGILPFFAYFYLGFWGLPILGIYLRKQFQWIIRADQNSSGLIRCITVWLSVTVFRWYLFSPSQLIRGVLVLSICYGIANAIHSLMVRGKS